MLIISILCLGYLISQLLRLVRLVRLLRLFRLVRHVLRSPLASTCAKQARSLAHANDLSL